MSPNGVTLCDEAHINLVDISQDQLIKKIANPASYSQKINFSCSKTTTTTRLQNTVILIVGV